MKRVNMPSIADQPIMLEDVKRIHLEPGDVLVVRAKRPLEQHHANMIREMCVRTFGDKQKIVVLDDNIDFEVYRASHEAEERSSDTRPSEGRGEANEGGRSGA